MEPLVRAFSVAELAAQFNEAIGTLEEGQKATRNLEYFQKYLTDIGAKTILVERDYIDRDYLEDFAAYYVRCFEKYRAVTTRLHFFNVLFEGSDFEALLQGRAGTLTDDGLRTSYLGFIVARPLRGATIGRTCLATYPSDGGRRHYPVVRPYDVNLYGIRLAIKSLAFQEQDGVVAACATCALWSTFHATGKLFQHVIPSPVEITKIATEHDIQLNSRALPNYDGLTATQVARAIRSVGLEPFAVNASDQHVLNTTIYAYVRGKVPPVLAFTLYDTSRVPEKDIGSHAVAIGGFSLGKAEPAARQEGKTGLLLKASRIDKIYVHDDQIGPFAQMTYRGPHLESSWKLADGTPMKVVPRFLLLPLYHKIRIPVATVYDAIVIVDSFLEHRRQLLTPNSPRIEWDIFLTTVNDFKDLLFKNARHHPHVAGILTTNLPRFMWQVSGEINGETSIDLLFDATGIESSGLLVGMLPYSPLIPQLAAGARQDGLSRVRNFIAKKVVGQLADAADGNK